MNKSKMPAILDPPTELSAANGYDLTFASSRATQRTAPAVGPGRFYVAGKRPFEGSRAFAIRFAWMREPRSYPLSSPLAGHEPLRCDLGRFRSWVLRDPPCGACPWP